MPLHQSDPFEFATSASFNLPAPAERAKLHRRPASDNRRSDTRLPPRARWSAPLASTLENPFAIPSRVLRAWLLQPVPVLLRCNRSIPESRNGTSPALSFPVYVLL